MISINKILFFNLIFILLFSLNAAETVLIPENSLLFKYNNVENNWDIKAIAQRDFYSEITKREKVFLKKGDVIGIYVDVYYLKTPQADGLCFFPEVRFERDKNGMIIPSVDRINSLMYLGILIVIIGLAALAGYFHLKSEKKYYLLPAALLLFFLGYSFWYIGFISNAFNTPTDELYYFGIAKDLLTGNIISEKYRYPAGFPILYIPSQFQNVLALLVKKLFFSASNQF